MARVETKTREEANQEDLVLVTLVWDSNGKKGVLSMLLINNSQENQGSKQRTIEFIVLLEVREQGEALLSA